VRRHYKNFLAAIDSRGRPVSDIEEGYITATSCILANIACDLGRTLTWDPDAARVVGDDEANRLLRSPYRSPWIHPDSRCLAGVCETREKTPCAPDSAKSACVLCNPAQERRYWPAAAVLS